MIGFRAFRQNITGKQPENNYISRTTTRMLSFSDPGISEKRKETEIFIEKFFAVLKSFMLQSIKGRGGGVCTQALFLKNPGCWSGRCLSLRPPVLQTGALPSELADELAHLAYTYLQT